MKPENINSLSEKQERAGAERFARDGFYLVPSVVPSDLLARVRPHIEAVYHGEYETGIAISGAHKPTNEPPTKLVKIDNAHRSDRTIHELVSHPAISKWAAAITGAKMVQVFATQLLIKPPGKEDIVNVGWHQDLEYWDGALEGEVFTAWVAVSDVTAESGPMQFVRGSHQWGLLKAGDFFSGNLDALKQRIQEKHGGNSWEEVAAVLPSGGVSFHHRLTVHGSGPNLASWQRVSFAVHLRTEKSALRPGVDWRTVGWLSDFNDPQGSPICYRENEVRQP